MGFSEFLIIIDFVDQEVVPLKSHNVINSTSYFYLVVIVLKATVVNIVRLMHYQRSTKLLFLRLGGSLSQSSITTMINLYTLVVNAI